MQPLSRRAFFGWLAAAVPATALVRRAHAAAIDHLASGPRTLHALGDTVLPSELSASGTAAAVARFQQWMTGYREGVEVVHGYGTSQLGYTGPTPATKWSAQLDRLDTSAKSLHGRAFNDLTRAQRRALVERELAAMKPDRLPAVGRAQHVALALLAHFYGSPQAIDLCYGAHVGRQTCRPLATQGRRPLPLATGGRS